MAKKKTKKRIDFSALGRKRSPAKTRAVRRNGKLGGRKPKFVIGDHAKANDKAPSDYRGRIGTIMEIGPGKSEFRVEYTDGGQPHGYLMSWWLDRVEA
jgi:hypothetical protein